MLAVGKNRAEHGRMWINLTLSEMDNRLQAAIRSGTVAEEWPSILADATAALEKWLPWTETDDTPTDDTPKETE